MLWAESGRNETSVLEAGQQNESCRERKRSLVTVPDFTLSGDHLL